VAGIRNIAKSGDNIQLYHAGSSTADEQPQYRQRPGGAWRRLLAASVKWQYR